MCEFEANEHEIATLFYTYYYIYFIHQNSFPQGIDSGRGWRYPGADEVRIKILKEQPLKYSRQSRLDN